MSTSPREVTELTPALAPIDGAVPATRPVSLAPAPAAGPAAHVAPSAAETLRMAMAVVLTFACIQIAGAQIGEVLTFRFVGFLGAGALFAYLRPQWRTSIAVAAGIGALLMLNPMFTLYFVAVVGALTVTRRRSGLFIAVLAFTAVVWPKTAFRSYYHHPGTWNWINEPTLTVALFVSAMWLRTRADARRGRPAPSDDPLSFFLYFFFPSHAANPMVFSPVLLSRERRVELAPVFQMLGWFVLKAAALVALRRLGPHAFLRGLTAADAAALGWPALWGVVVVSYAEVYLTLAASADIPILIARLYGFPLPDPFRYPLLAWNPVELWRRWGIYNRHILLQLVYFPLGGSQRRKYLNVMITFLASALLLHSGWFGSKYWEVGPAGWRDQSIYFLLQGLAVCSCLALWDVTGKRPARGGRPALSLALIGAVFATQAWSALAHVVILAQNMDLASRGRLVARCLGLMS